MRTFKEHIIYKISIVALVLALLAPTFAKFSHVFEAHVHEICKNPQKIHFHEFHLDCEFYRFKLNNQFFFATNNFQFLNTQEHLQVIAIHYSYLSNYLPLSFLHRGPPQMI